MGKWYRIFVMSLFVLYGITLVVIMFAFQDSTYSPQPLVGTMTIEPQDIIKITMSSPTQIGEDKTTTDKRKIEQIINYLNQFEYDRLLNDETTYMPKRASIIYFFDDNTSNFIVPYGDEAMISQKVYKVKKGSIDKDYLKTFYNSLKN